MTLQPCAREGCTNILRSGLPHLASDPWFCGEHEPKKNFTGPLPKCAVETCAARAARAMGEDTLCAFHKEKGEPIRFLNKGIPLNKKELYGKSPAQDILKDIKELKSHAVIEEPVAQRLICAELGCFAETNTNGKYCNGHDLSIVHECSTPNCAGVGEHLTAGIWLCGKCWIKPFITNRAEHTVIEDKVVDFVNSPPHYNQGGVECIDAIEAAIGSEALQDHCIATAIKYLWRWKHKNGVQDLRKAIWYINKAIDTKIME